MLAIFGLIQHREECHLNVRPRFQEFYADPTTGALIRVIQVGLASSTGPVQCKRHLLTFLCWQHGFSGDVVMNILSFQAGPIDPDVFDVVRWSLTPTSGRVPTVVPSRCTGPRDEALELPADAGRAARLRSG